MLVTVKFHGIMKKLCPDEYKVNADTPAEAIRGVVVQIGGKLRRKDGSRFICWVKECQKMIELNSSLTVSELNLFPAFNAGGSGQGMATWGNMIIGATLIVIGAIIGVTLGWTGVAGAFAVGLIMTGAGMFLEGMANLIWGVDTAKDTSNPESSRAFGNTNSNTTKIGTRIAIGYGMYKIAGQYISLNTQAVDRGKNYDKKTGKKGIYRFLSISRS